MFALQIIAGLIYSAGFKPIGFWFAVPIALALQIHLLHKYNYKVLQSFIFAFTSGLVILSWSKTFVGVIPWLLLALLQGLLALPIGAAARYTHKFAPIIFAMLLMEEVRARFPFGGFAWTRIAFSQVDSPLAPLVSIGGVISLSLVTLYLAQLLLERRVRNLVLLATLVLVSFLVVPGASSIGSLNVRAVQGGVPERGLNFNARAQAVLDNHIAQTMESTESADELIVWPENAIDVSPLRNKVAAEKLKSLSLTINKPIIAGVILDEEDLYNATVLIDEGGTIQSIYRKRYLTPFGEFIPLRWLASTISPHVVRVSDFSPGDELVTHKVQGRDIASVICYELINDGLVREAASASQLLLVHTNSATFSGSSEGEQQLAITRLRAIESGRSVVSISTTGPSALIDQRGVVVAKLRDGQVGSLSGSMRMSDSMNFSVKAGGWMTFFVLLFTLVLALMSLRRKGHQE